METTFDTLVIGAGQAGLATGYQLQRAGQRFAILEASDEPGGSWPHYYDSLRLFSPARFSSLPGMAFPGDPERYPARDEVIAYLRGYAARFRLPVITGARVQSVERDSNGFHVRTADGRGFRAASLIAATGAFHRPHLPRLPGQEQFGGTIRHSFAYRQPEPFAGQRVVVVGGGNSAVQIAVELARTARVSLATREPVRFVTQRPYGRDVHFWWSLLRFDTSPLESPQARLFARLAAGKGPRVLDAGVYRAALAAGAPDVRPMFSSFTAGGVVWADGEEEAVDSVIFATGYRPNLDYLAPLGALGGDGQPLQHHGVSSAVPGLGFVGLSNQRSFASAALRGVGPDAAVVVRALRRQAQQPRLWPFWRAACCPAGSQA
ncbi:MAG TPA: NAD(P)-binding domain-containing protein [Chloroflexaceae bacterium]|nr:NAD(P)-binding domain-containing protein [Chloroflexaceae bacterium]